MPLPAVGDDLGQEAAGALIAWMQPALGLDETAGTQGGLFADFDDDGDPDLLVGGSEGGRATVLWRNDGGAFTDVTSAAFGSLPVVTGADWGDYDNDGDMDLAVVEGDDGI